MDWRHRAMTVPTHLRSRYGPFERDDRRPYLPKVHRPNGRRSGRDRWVGIGRYRTASRRIRGLQGAAQLRQVHRLNRGDLRCNDPIRPSERCQAFPQAQDVNSRPQFTDVNRPDRHRSGTDRVIGKHVPRLPHLHNCAGHSERAVPSDARIRGHPKPYLLRARREGRGLHDRNPRFVAVHRPIAGSRRRDGRRVVVTDGRDHK